MSPIKLAVFPTSAALAWGMLTQDVLLQWASTIGIVVIGLVTVAVKVWKMATPEVLDTMRQWRADRRKDLANTIRSERAVNAQLRKRVDDLEDEVAWWKKRDERGSREVQTRE